MNTSYPPGDGRLVDAERLCRSLLGAEMLDESLVDVVHLPASTYEISHSIDHEISHLQCNEQTHINADMELKDRMKAARKHAKLTQAQLATKANVDQAVISNLERGVADGSKKLSAIAKACGVDRDWLESGEGSMPQQSPVGMPIPDLEKPLDELKMVPFEIEGIPVISYVQAGEFCDAEDPFPPGYSDEYLPFRPPNAGPRAYALRVEGDSNDPKIRHGEYVIVDPDKAEEPGKFVVAKRADGKVTLKMLQYDEGMPYLKAANPAWPEPIIRVDGDWSICGVVIGKYDPM